MPSRPEKYAESRFVREAARTWPGCDTPKVAMAGPFGTRGRSDRQFFGPYRCTVFFEFKRLKKKPTKLQKIRHRNLRRLGHKVYVVYTWQKAMEIAEREVTKAKEAWRLYPKVVSKGMHTKGSGKSCRWIPFSARAR